jgi:hypothetical protein
MTAKLYRIFMAEPKTYSPFLPAQPDAAELKR